MRRRRSVAAFAATLLAASLAVAGCTDSSGSGSDGDGGSRNAAAGPAERQAEGPANDSRKSGQADAADQEPADRDSASGKSAPDDKPVKLTAAQVIRTATVTVRVKDVPDTLDRARTAVDGVGGYVGDETTDRDAAGHERSTVRLRVPPSEYQGVLDEMSGLGKLVAREVKTQDVTDQVVDVESRISSQQASVRRIRDLMDRADALGDVVTLEGELSTREADLEALQAQRASLKKRTGMATITLVLQGPDAKSATPGKDKDDDTGFADALGGGWDAFTTTVRWIAVALGAVLPFAAAAGLLFLLWRVLGGRLPRIRTAAGTAPGTSVGTSMAAPPRPVTAPAGPGPEGPDGPAPERSAEGRSAGEGREHGEEGRSADEGRGGAEEGRGGTG